MPASRQLRGPGKRLHGSSDRAGMYGPPRRGSLAVEAATLPTASACAPSGIVARRPCGGGSSAAPHALPAASDPALEKVMSSGRVV
jgi:hypothetical protein